MELKSNYVNRYHGGGKCIHIHVYIASKQDGAELVGKNKIDCNLRK